MKVDSKKIFNEPPIEIDAQLAVWILELDSYANWLITRLPKSMARHIGSMDRDDLLQETYLEGRKNWERVWQSPDSSAYLRGIMRNIVRAWFKNALRRSQISDKQLGIE